MLERDKFNWLQESNDPDGYASGDEYAEEIKLQAREAYDRDLSPEQVKEAQEQWEAVVLIGFEEWSSGFAPDSEHQITTYLDYGMDKDKDREAVRQALLKHLEA